jgi:acyl carrier protein
MPALIEPETLTNLDEFRTALLDFIHDVLPTLDRRPRQQWRVETDTPLFETGLIDSLAILHLMAFVEQFTGRAVPPRRVVMKHFRTANAIVETFGMEEGNDNH